MNSLKSAVMRSMGRWWCWMPVSAIGALFLILFIALVVQWIASDYRVPFSDAGPELLFVGLGFHGYVLVAIATIGVPFAIWRGLALQQQSEAASKQSEAASRQSEIARSHLLNDRYQKGVELLCSEALSARIGGIYTLEQLAKNDPPTYHIPIMSMFSVFVRNSLINNEQKGPPEDVCTILEVIGRRSSKQHEIESERNYTINLKGARLCGWKHYVPFRVPKPDFSNVDFSYADLSQADISLVKLVRSRFVGANLLGAKLFGADLSHAHFFDTDLSDAVLARANLSEVSFSCVKLFGTSLEKADGLTQEQLKFAQIDPQRPPVLTDTVDVITKQPITVPPQSH